MTAPREIAKNLWTFPITLPKNPLKWLNCYVIKGEDGGRNLLVDSGFPMAECADDLRAGIETLGLDMHNTDVFFTHHHTDHTGNSKLLEDMGARTFISRADLHVWRTMRETDSEDLFQRLLAEGAPREIAYLFAQRGKGMDIKPIPDNIAPVDEGDVLSYGGYELECIPTPGHTPGHMCLYDREKKLIILGDHVLFDITPNITLAVDFDNPLKAYLENLVKIKELPVETALPGHRNTSDMSVAERVDRILAHHDRRLAELEALIAQSEGGISAYRLAAGLSWKIRAANWEEFPAAQKWFAYGETLAHLDYLVGENRIKRITSDGKVLYFPL